MLAFMRARAGAGGGIGAVLAAPVALWALGAGELASAAQNSCAIVGTRAASGYGERVAGGWAAELAEAGLTVISGAAYGVDAAAHRGALSAEGTTVAVLACGVDIPYPSGHAGLLRRIAEKGLVLTEYPPSTRPAKHRFLARNRIIAGLAGGVLVVEAGNRSGALNTASWARMLGLPLFAVPGPVDALNSAGCHRLVASGEAELAPSAGALIERIGPLGLFCDDQPDCRRALDDLSPDEGKVHGTLAAKTARSVTTVSRSSGLAMPAALAALSLLELRGLAVQDEGGGWTRRAGTSGG
jgi:DNA processing protein